VYLIRVEAFDWNCPQHIVPRYTVEEIREALAPFESKMEELERENARLRGELETMGERLHIDLKPRFAGARAMHLFWLSGGLFLTGQVPAAAESTADLARQIAALMAQAPTGKAHQR